MPAHCPSARHIVIFAFAVLLPWMALAQTAAAPTGKLDAAAVQNTVESVSAVIAREYFDPTVAQRITATLHTRLADGAYADARDAGTLAATLTADLLAESHDKHLAVGVVPTGRTDTARPPAESRQEAVRRTNGGVQRVEILPGNVGYLNLTAFWRIGEAREAISTAMRLLAHADALIIDMRENGGGSPDTVALVISYLLDGTPTPLFDIAPRYGKPARYATAKVAAANGRRPVYVLTAASSFSAAEGFPFLLQERRRAEVVGEVTAGAANPGRPYPVNALFEVVVPNGRLSSVTTGRNWEGIGVTPDVAAPAADALRVAHERALRRLIDTASTDDARVRLTDALRPLRE
jgi:retinol-binding protein 3